jgi:hypothetical protein
LCSQDPPHWQIWDDRVSEREISRIETVTRKDLGHGANRIHLMRESRFELEV